MQDAGQPAVQGCRVAFGPDSIPKPGGLDAVDLDIFVIVEKWMKQADGVGAAADAGHQLESGSRPSASIICSRTSRPMMVWKSRTMAG